jgi:hypothetical protein
LQRRREILVDASSKANPPLQFIWDCEIEDVPADDLDAVRRGVQQWILTQAGGWQPGEHNIEFEMTLSGDDYTIAGTVDYTPDTSEATITRCFGANDAEPLQILWGCQVVGVPANYIPEVRAAVQQHISEAYRNWEPGEQQLRFAMEIDELEYDIQVRVMFTDDPGPTAHIVYCDGEEG